MKSSDKDNNGKRKISLQLSEKLVAGIDRLRSEWGLRSRGDTVERLIGELLVEPQPADLDDDTPVEAATPSEAVAIDEGFDEGGALVLLAQPSQGGLAVNFIEGQSRGGAGSSKGTGGPAIDLPGFVRRQSEQLKRSLQPPAPRETVERDPLPLVNSSSLKAALVAAQQHWIDLYGTAPNEHVLEASMRWLAKDIWPQLDQSDGRPFTWTLACRLIEELAPSWPAGEPTFARVMTMAGLLEDPFSSATLSLRLPSLIRRFVHRMRRRQRGMSFETLENTMSLHGALKLLQLPTAPGHRLTLGDIREAYKEQALVHHPDSGGNPEQMRRLNEAYQLLKELYRTKA